MCVCFFNEVPKCMAQLMLHQPDCPIISCLPTPPPPPLPNYTAMGIGVAVAVIFGLAALVGLGFCIRRSIHTTYQAFIDDATFNDSLSARSNATYQEVLQDDPAFAAIAAGLERGARHAERERAAGTEAEIPSDAGGGGVEEEATEATEVTTGIENKGAIGGRIDEGATGSTAGGVSDLDLDFTAEGAKSSCSSLQFAVYQEALEKSSAKLKEAEDAARAAVASSHPVSGKITADQVKT